MEGFRDFMNDSDSDQHECYSLEYDGYIVFIHFRRDPEAVAHFTEAQHKGIPLGGPYSAQYHRAHTPQGWDHIHVYHRNNQIFALNSPGTAHDKSHKTKIPTKVADAIRGAFPNIKVPKNNYIENAEPHVLDMFGRLLLG